MLCHGLFSQEERTEIPRAATPDFTLHLNQSSAATTTDADRSAGRLGKSCAADDISHSSLANLCEAQRTHAVSWVIAYLTMHSAREPLRRTDAVLAAPFGLVERGVGRCHKTTGIVSNGELCDSHAYRDLLGQA